MTGSGQRISLKELGTIVAFYQSQFPAWRVARQDTIVREAGPVLQGVCFERLSGGVYRPIGHIRVLPAPRSHWGLELPQDLPIDLRTIDRRRHEAVKHQVAEAMRAAFLPGMDLPLVAAEVLDFYELRAHPNYAQAYSLTALNAYLNRDDRARYWIARYKELLAATEKPLNEVDAQRNEFLRQLEDWLRAGTAQEQLERVLQDERRKWGLV